MEVYKRWIRMNKEYVHSMESLANGLTWLLPERFSESEIGPEAVTSFFGIITSINEHIIETTPSQRVPGQAEPSSFPYSLCVTLLKDLETLVEVAAQQLYGDDRKWNFIAATEAIKVFIRLAIFRNSGYKMLLHGGETMNVETESDDASTLRPGHLVKAGNFNKPGNSKMYNGHMPWNLEGGGKAMSALNRFGENARMVSEPTWLKRVQHHQAMVEPAKVTVEKPNLSTFLAEKGVPGGLLVTGEVMFILRPLIYVLLIRKCGTKSWFPWLTSLAVDLIGNALLSYVMMLRNSSKAPLFYLSSHERDELKRRKLLWALYILRDPFFAKYTRNRLERAQKALEPVPFVGFITEKLIELLVGAQTRYTYMSGS